MCASISSRGTPGTYSLPNTRTYRVPSACAASCRFASPICSGASSGTLVRSMFVWIPRSSTAANWCSAAKSRIFGHGHVGQPRVENPRGSFLGACQGNSSAAAVPTNSRRVVIVCSESSFEVTVTATPAPARLPYRWTICALLFVVTTINYMDRQVLSILAPTLQRELSWSESQYAAVVYSFTLVYAF